MTETIAKLNRILEGLMSCRLEFLPATEVSAADWNAHDLNLVRVNEDGAPGFIEGEATGMIGFPINVQGSFAGLAVVQGLSAERSARMIELAGLLSTVLESSMIRSDRGDDLRVIEERIRVLEAENDSDSTVIKLRRARVAELSVADIPEAHAPLDAAITATPLLLEAKAGFPLQRLAIEIHQMSQRWAFLTLESLSSTIFDSREELKELGGVTIFVEDVTRLSAEQQLRLAEYLSTQPGQDLPQVIAGSPLPSAELRARGVTLPRLLDLFCVFEIGTSDQDATTTSELIETTLRLLVEKTRSRAAHPNPEVPEKLRSLNLIPSTPSNVHPIAGRRPTLH